jgi:uncharacterized integral membrane protein (TIGR00697 family)
MAIFLVGLYIACELVANITASKPVAVGSLVVPAAVFIYAITFTLVDLINEKLGKIRARQVVYTAFAANLLLAGYIQLAVSLPAASFYSGEQQEAFAAVLGSTPRIVLASLVAYLMASLIDVEVFAWWRRRIGGFRWARVLASNAVSTLVDSMVFISVAFWGVFPLLPLIQGQYIVKMGVTAVSLPLIYLVRAMRTRAEASELA